MFPKKGRKQMTVHGVLYYYIVSGYVTVTYQNTVTREKFQWHNEVKPKWKQEMTGRHVRKIILDEIGYGHKRKI